MVNEPTPTVLPMKEQDFDDLWRVVGLGAVMTITYVAAQDSTVDVTATIVSADGVLTHRMIVSK